jgi:hypothetical protein
MKKQKQNNNPFRFLSNHYNNKLNKYINNPNHDYYNNNNNTELPEIDSDTFIELCNKHIMVNNLDKVIKTTHLQKGNCNIFLIGEYHYKKSKNLTVSEYWICLKI